MNAILMQFILLFLAAVLASAAEPFWRSQLHCLQESLPRCLALATLLGVFIAGPEQFFIEDALAGFFSSLRQVPADSLSLMHYEMLAAFGTDAGVGETTLSFILALIDLDLHVCEAVLVGLDHLRVFSQHSALGHGILALLIAGLAGHLAPADVGLFLPVFVAEGIQAFAHQ